MSMPNSAEQASFTAWLDQTITDELTKHHGDVVATLACMRGKYLAAMQTAAPFDARHLGGTVDGLQIARVIVEAAAARAALANVTGPDSGATR